MNRLKQIAKWVLTSKVEYEQVKADCEMSLNKKEKGDKRKTRQQKLRQQRQKKQQRDQSKYKTIGQTKSLQDTGLSSKIVNKDR